MATDKTFTVVGVSKLDGVFKVRYANSVKRGAVLAKNGHTDIVLVEMPFEGRKEDAVDCLLNVLAELPAEAQEAVLVEAREFGFVV